MNVLAILVVLCSVQKIRSYKTYDNLYHSKMCEEDKWDIAWNPFSGKPKIQLHKRGNESAAIVNNTWLAADVSKNPASCSFKVELKQYSKYKTLGGIYITIQQLNMRLNKRNGECLDYIQFKFSNGKQSQKYCSDANTLIFDQDTRGSLEVNMFIERHTKLPPEYSLSMSLIFTAFTKCEYTDQFMCIPGQENSCIDRGFVHDDINNCPPPYCSDENNKCVGMTDDILEPIDKKNIIISAITSLIFTVVGVGSCAFLCYKYRVCFNECSRTTSVRAQAHEAPSIEMPVASAPTCPELPSSEEKDLPPPYDTLFPSR